MPHGSRRAARMAGRKRRNFMMLCSLMRMARLVMLCSLMRMARLVTLQPVLSGRAFFGACVCCSSLGFYEVSLVSLDFPNR